MGANAQREAEDKVRSWGFSTVFTHTDRPNAYYPPHTHRGTTTHLLLAGSLTIAYPDDQDGDGNGDSDSGGPPPARETHHAGARVDVDAGRRHEVWVGEEGCRYVIGE